MRYELDLIKSHKRTVKINQITIMSQQRSSEPPVPSKKVNLPERILNIPGIDNGTFRSFIGIKVEPAEKFAFLHQIRVKRLAQPLDLSHCMKDVCNLIPETLDGDDLEAVGYHRQCYQQFTKNQGRLKDLSDIEPSTSQAHRSQRKRSASETRILLPPQCIYCEKVMIKTCGNTERPTQFYLRN